ncbi:hypothetical protein [Streptacidiphilus rugosus]|uniref:hypothetical protein n=1 Tax=Streptacidiphilus rugosus TaxID=405783 RepID=UPI00056A50FF|nr:hypothetical protein [Streptacidiphilus rugosus]
MALSSPPDPKRKGSGCAISVAAVALAAVLLMVWAYVSVQNWINPPPPDVHKIATSADVAGADQTATVQLNNTLAEVHTTIPWIAAVGRSADDVCSTSDNIAFIGEKPKWSPVSCIRTTAWFGAFDGDLPQQLARINQALSKAGWMPQGTPMDQLFQIDQAHAATASPTPGRPRLAYAYGSYSNGGQVLNIEVTQLPGMPFSDIPQVRPTATLPAETPLNGPSTFDREHQSVSIASLTQKAGGGNRYIIGVELNSRYYTAPVPSTSAPAAPSQGTGYACRTGSACVGG